MLEQHIDLQLSATERARISKKNLMLMKGDKNWTYTRLFFRPSKRLRTIGDNDTDAEKKTLERRLLPFFLYLLLFFQHLSLPFFINNAVRPIQTFLTTTVSAASEYN
jgi:hypothetical protein